MNHQPRRDDAAASAEVKASSSARSPAEPSHRSADDAALRLRSVHRAMAELKRGTPVVLLGAHPLVLAPAETVGARGLAEIGRLASADPVLLLAAARAGAVFGSSGGVGAPADLRADLPVQAIALPPSLLVPQLLRGLADPTVDQILPDDRVQAAEVPHGAQAALALVKLARLLPAAVAAPVAADVLAQADQLDLLMVESADVLAYPQAMATHLVRVAEAVVPLENVPDARVIAFRSPDSGVEHLAILVGRPEETPLPLVRMHSECFTGDLLGSLRCDCGPQLRGAIARMADEGSGVLLYLSQEGRGIGLVNKLRAYALQDSGLDTVDANRALGWGADERNFLVAATMLEQLGIDRVRLLTNNPDKVTALVACGIDVVSRERHVFAPNGVNDQYLATKTERFGHLL